MLFQSILNMYRSSHHRLTSCSSPIVYNPWEPLSISHVSVISGQAPSPAGSAETLEAHHRRIAMTRMKLASACALYRSAVVVYAFQPESASPITLSYISMACLRTSAPSSPTSDTVAAQLVASNVSSFQT